MRRENWYGEGGGGDGGVVKFDTQTNTQQQFVAVRFLKPENNQIQSIKIT